MSEAGSPFPLNPNAFSISVLIAGSLKYEDRTFDTGGYLALENKPIRYATVQLIDIETGTVLDTTSSDRNGHYAFDERLLTTSTKVAVRTIAQSEAGSVFHRDSVGNETFVYSVESDAIAATGGALQINCVVGSDAGSGIGTVGHSAGAFNILDMLVVGYQSAVGWMKEAQELSFIKGAHALWEPGNLKGLAPVYMDPTSSSIVIGDGLQYDYKNMDLSILHEYGHYMSRPACS